MAATLPHLLLHGQAVAVCPVGRTAGDLSLVLSYDRYQKVLPLWGHANTVTLARSTGGCQSALPSLPPLFLRRYQPDSHLGLGEGPPPTPFGAAGCLQPPQSWLCDPMQGPVFPRRPRLPPGPGPAGPGGPFPAGGGATEGLGPFGRGQVLAEDGPGGPGAGDEELSGHGASPLGT